ncbi:lysophospholipid acyltransferase 5 [Drosophila tropicalis]|uniref:lysophospholipid acyltransferase 5 n=1 Tax=Drosophila tropicalis TaxID=46794 RepID=UPI0035ABDB42
MASVDTEFRSNLPPSSGLLGGVAQRLDVTVEALRLLLTLLAGYPIAFVYCKYIVNSQAKRLHHLYFAICGASLCYFNYGLDVYHSLLGILTTYLLGLFLRHKPKIFLTANFIFHMTYLMLGYYYTASNEYDILWTMPHCILVLRMIGYGFDLTDGLKPQSELSEDQKETNLPQFPSLLELLAFAYFPGGFLVGPQFPYRRYQRFIDGEFRKHKGQLEAGLNRLAAGVLYLIVSQVGLYYLPDSYFLSPEFTQLSLIRRMYYLGFWAKFSLYKYISCWLFTEGALICIGFTFKKASETGPEGNADWSGCSNVKLVHLETGNTMEHYVQTFNVNTNQWVGRYIYKRLRFLNNRMISYGASLVFLAIWHGFHSGYYMAFVMEYMIVSTEKQITNMYEKKILPNYGNYFKDKAVYKALHFFALKSYNIIYMGWCLSSFVFLKYERWIRVYSAVNYFGFIYMLIWAAIYHGYFYFFEGPRQQQVKRETGRRDKEDNESKSKENENLVEENAKNK